MSPQYPPTQYPSARFSPQVPPLPHVSHGEMLGRYVPTALRRTPPVARLIHPIKLTIWGFFTVGFWPLHKLQQRVDRVLQMQAHQTELAGDLMAIHSPAEDKSLLAESTQRVRVSPIPWVLSRSCFWASLVAAAAFILYDGHSLWALWRHPLKFGDATAQIYIAAMSLSYLLLMLQMNLQVVAMQKLAIAVNGVFESQKPVEAPRLVFIGRSPLTILLGILLAWNGLVWALPMAIAWSAFKQFVKVSAYEFRVGLSDRLTAISGVTPVVDTRDLCPNPKCRNVIPEGADFCPRCGTTVVHEGSH